MLKTTFWKNAAASLPASVRERYRVDIEQAERWELVIDGVIEFFSRAKAGPARAANAPRGAH